MQSPGGERAIATDARLLFNRVLNGMLSRIHPTSPRQVVTRIGALLMVSALAGCAAQVVPAGPDTYSVSSSGAGFSTAGVRSRAYRAATDFCSKRGLVMVPVSFDAQGGVLGSRPPTADLVFRALRPGDPDIKRPNVETPTVIQRIQVR